MTPLEQALLAISGNLEQENIPYMVIGGIANAVWGEPRATIDVDILIWVNDEAIESTINHLQQNFRILPEKPGDFISKTRVLPIEAENGVRIDIVFGMLPFEKTAISRSVARDVSGVSISFCTPEDLILLKLVSIREKDLQDVKGLIKRRWDTLDIQYLEPRVEEVAELLDRPEIMKRWKEWLQNDY